MLIDLKRSMVVGNRRQANTAIVGITKRKAVAIIGRRYSWSAGQTAESWSMAEEAKPAKKSEGEGRRRCKVEELKGECQRRPCAVERGTRCCLATLRVGKAGDGWKLGGVVIARRWLAEARQRVLVVVLWVVVSEWTSRG